MPLIWEHRPEGLDFSALQGAARHESGYPPPQSAVAGAFQRLLCAPEPAFSIALERDGPADLPARVGSRRAAITDGVQHGMAVYFVAHFDAVHRFTNAPLEPPTNWPPVLLRTEARERRSGEIIDVELTADPLERLETWRWKVER
jgi:type I protein arginine methyltransferase